MIVVDPVEKRVYEKTLKDKLKSFQKIVGGYIEGYYGISGLWPGHAMYVNEEGKLKPPPHYGWRVEGIPEVFVGAACIFRVAGSSERSATISAEDVASKVAFLGAGTAPVGRPVIVAW